MRLIDGDVLFREMEKAQWYNNADRDEIAEELVLNAPTIEPQRKKGKWIYGEDYIGRDGWICDKCGHFIAWDYSVDLKSAEKDLPNFCPKCGADMREDGESDEPKRCDTCKHEKSRWFSRCADCSDYELWEAKDEPS